jgi:hypothetical protein
LEQRALIVITKALAGESRRPPASRDGAQRPKGNTRLETQTLEGEDSESLEAVKTRL